jgi:hypothetical protein
MPDASLDRRTAKITRSLQGGDMANEPVWARRTPPKAQTRAAGSISCMVFLAAMAAAFWCGAVWASQAWFVLPGN